MCTYTCAYPCLVLSSAVGLSSLPSWSLPSSCLLLHCITRAHTYIHTRTRTYIHTRTRTHSHTRTRTHANAHTRTHAHTRTRTISRAHKHRWGVSRMLMLRDAAHVDNVMYTCTCTALFSKLLYCIVLTTVLYCTPNSLPFPPSRQTERVGGREREEEGGREGERDGESERGEEGGKAKKHMGARMSVTTCFLLLLLLPIASCKNVCNHMPNAAPGLIPVSALSLSPILSPLPLSPSPPPCTGSGV